MLRLGINTGFAVNRYSEPERWADIVSNIGVNYVQFTADLLNVSMPRSIVKNQTKRIKKACETRNIEISSTFTGAFTRVNHLAHPDREIRKYWVNWFKKYAELTADFETKIMGSHFGIFTFHDDRNQEIRAERLNQNIACWHEVADYASGLGIEKIIWEPMSISREQGETIRNCRVLQNKVNENAPLPFEICLDVDHGDVCSGNPSDTDPYEWLKEFARESPVIHLKQSSSNKSGHWPFTPEFNKDGRINAKTFIAFLDRLGIRDCDLILELSFREREPTDSNVEGVLKQSVQYWREYVAE